MRIDELFKVSTSRQPTWEEIAACCASLGDDTEGALNSIALSLAERYDLAQMDFATADVVANALHSWCLLTRDRVLPDPAYQVFLAFDEGEYHHASDSRDVDPEVKYTRPMIKDVLRGRNGV
jgi:hypothetical protein